MKHPIFVKIHRGRAERRRGLSRLHAAGLALLLLLAPLPAAAQETPTSAATLEECTSLDESALPDELNALAQAVFQGTVADLDLQRVVDESWAELGIDAVVAESVDRAVQNVSATDSDWDTWLSNWSGVAARDLTEAVANETFGSEPFRKAMDELSNAVAARVSDEISLRSAESVSAALYCLQTFVRGNYSQSLVQTFEDELRSVTTDAGLGEEALEPSLLSILDQHKAALGGVGIIIATQVTKRIALSVTKRVAQRATAGIASRILGRIGTQVIPLIGWVVGSGLLVWDIWESRDGALPQIQEQLKSPEVAEGIRSEIAAAIGPELELELPTLAREIANDLHGQWANVKRDMRVVLDLASQDTAYAAALDATETEEELARLVGITSALLENGGTPSALAAAQSGELLKAVTLPADVTPIVAASGSLADALAWSISAGASLDEVLALELYKSLDPNTLERAQLEQLIAVGDSAVIARLAALPPPQLATLLGLSRATLDELTQAFTTEQLGWIAGTMEGLNASQRATLLQRLAGNPALLPQLQQSNLLATLPVEANLDAALSFVGGPRDAFGIFNDGVAVFTGAPTLGMFRAKYGWAMTIALWVVLILLALILVRLLLGLWEWFVRPLRSVSGGGRER